jgi:hypothetical protein
MIIGINGYAGSGKDTVGTIIQYLMCPHRNANESLEDILKEPSYHEWWLEDESGWEIKKWAGKLKLIASILTGIEEKKFEDQDFKRTDLSHHWSTLRMKAGKRQDGIFPKKINMESVPMTVRDFLQKLGTDAIRDGLHTNAWVNALMSDYVPTQQQWSDGPLGGYENGPLPNWIVTDTRFPNEAQAIKDAGGIVIRVDRPLIRPINDHPSEIGLDDWKFDYKIANVSDIVSLSLTVLNILKQQKLI